MYEITPLNPCHRESKHFILVTTPLTAMMYMYFHPFFKKYTNTQLNHQGHSAHQLTFVKSALLISSPGLPHDPSHPGDRSQTLKQLTTG